MGGAAEDARKECMADSRIKGTKAEPLRVRVKGRTSHGLQQYQFCGWSREADHIKRR